LGEHGVVCRVGDLMPEDLTVEALGPKVPTLSKMAVRLREVTI